jgi:hypothetical protein
MAVELDHVFILCAVGAPEAESLVALGLREGSPNTHPGQGTACRRFFFGNAYLELVWVSDADEAQRDPARSTGLFERWSRRGSGASPFGVVLRPGAGPRAADDPGGGPHGDPTASLRPPFPTWPYRPPYMPPGIAIEIAVGTPLSEPEMFFIPVARRPDAIGREPTAHLISAAAITRVEVGVPGGGARSAAARSVEAAGAVSFMAADEHLMTMTLDAHRTGGTADLRPALPLELRW